MGLSHHDRDKGGTKDLYPINLCLRRALLLMGLTLQPPPLSRSRSNSCICLGLLLPYDAGKMGNWVLPCLKCPLPVKEIILQSEAKCHPEGLDINWHSFSSQAKDGLKLSSKCHMRFFPPPPPGAAGASSFSCSSLRTWQEELALHSAEQSPMTPWRDPAPGENKLKLLTESEHQTHPVLLDLF